jgi:2-oxo-4-hydroxy-4-carboxy-5-ureidoimidazoline decarboxylase
VRASGRSAAELLALLRRRLGNDPADEREVVRNELASITRLRLAKLLRAGSDGSGGGAGHQGTADDRAADR